MRNRDGSLVGDLGDNIVTAVTSSMLPYNKSIIDENQTLYSILPIDTNNTPKFTTSITDNTTPPTLPYPPKYKDPFNFIENITAPTRLYQTSDRTIKVLKDTTFSLSVTAEQPDALNIENGIPTVIPPLVGITYIWFKDGEEIETSTLTSIDGNITITNNTLTFNNIQPTHAGLYSCDATNDSGTTSSDECTIEVVNVSEDGFYFRNLIKNPNGDLDTEDWESTNDELTTKPFITTEKSVEFKEVTNVDQFGYTVDMMHPRPYQLDYSPLIDSYTSTVTGQKTPHYFTRTRFKYINNDGLLTVKAYQDIDLSDLQAHIRGGVYGIAGVRAFFSCYIGNAISKYIPTDTMLQSNNRTDISNYWPGNMHPRISAENFVYAGPGVLFEKVYVTVEEYDNGNRLPSTTQDLNKSHQQGANSTEADPWPETTSTTKELIKFYDSWYNTVQEKNTGIQYYTGANPSSGNVNDAVLRAADEIMPDQKERYTYGQHIQFNKAIISQLNDKTTKIRITLNFETTDVDNLVNERWKEAIEALSEDTFEFRYYQSYAKREAWNLADNDTIYGLLRNLSGNENKDFTTLLRRAPDPRGMVTGLNLSLMPIYSENTELNDYNTRIALTINENTPAAFVPSTLNDPPPPPPPPPPSPPAPTGSNTTTGPIATIRVNWKINVKNWTDLTDTFKIETGDAKTNINTTILDLNNITKAALLDGRYTKDTNGNIISGFFMNYPQYAYKVTRHVTIIPPYQEKQQIQVLVKTLPVQTETQTAANQTVSTVALQIPFHLKDESPINITSLEISGTS